MFVTQLNLAAHFLELALLDRLPKSPAGPKRFSPDGKPLTGLAPRTALNYLPTLSYRLFRPLVAGWWAEDFQARLPAGSSGLIGSALSTAARRFLGAAQTGSDLDFQAGVAALKQTQQQLLTGFGKESSLYQELSRQIASLEKTSAGLEEESMKGFMKNLRRVGPSRTTIVLSEGVLDGTGSMPGLGPLLFRFPKELSQEEWAAVNQRVILQVENESDAQRFGQAGYSQVAQWPSEIFAMIQERRSERVVLFLADESDWLLHGQLAEASVVSLETVHLNSSNFLDAWGALFEILGYIKPGPETLKPVAESLRQAA